MFLWKIYNFIGILRWTHSCSTAVHLEVMKLLTCIYGCGPNLRVVRAKRRFQSYGETSAFCCHDSFMFPLLVSISLWVRAEEQLALQCLDQGHVDSKCLRGVQQYACFISCTLVFSCLPRDFQVLFGDCCLCWASSYGCWGGLLEGQWQIDLDCWDESFPTASLSPSHRLMISAYSNNLARLLDCSDFNSEKTLIDFAYLQQKVSLTGYKIVFDPNPRSNCC